MATVLNHRGPGLCWWSSSQITLLLIHTPILHNIAQQFKDPVLSFFKELTVCDNAKLHNRGNIFFYTMNRLMNTLLFKTPCLTSVFFTCIFSQTLYETDHQQYSILNRKSNDVSLQSLLDETEALLKEKTSYLQKCMDMKDSYNDSLIMNNQEQTTRCGNIYFLKYCIFFFFLLWWGTEFFHLFKSIF